VLGRSKTAARGIPPLESPNGLIQSDVEKAELFNQFFARKASVEDSNAYSPPLPRLNVSNMPEIRFRPRVVRKLLREINSAKSPGFDFIQGAFLKECAGVLAFPLARLFQLSYDQGRVPTEWKRAKVIPVHKKKSKSDPANYRPIALLSLVSKVMERYITFHLVKHLEGNHILSSSQFGFRAGHSTFHPLLVLHHKINELLDKQQECRIVALDISGAFDCVWHSRLLQKLDAYGVAGKNLAWLSDYLSNRKQVVCIEDAVSTELPVTAGVPQGSLLGPVLFSIYINDLPSVMNNMSLIYADDVTVFCDIKSIRQRAHCASSVSDDLSSAVAWSQLNQMSFSAAKSQSMLISRKRDRDQNPRVAMGSHDLESMETLNLLGVTFSKDGSLSAHIMNKARTAGKLVSMLYRNRMFLSEQARFRVYVACIRPIMEYACPLFTNAAAYALRAIDKIDQRARRLFPSVSIDPIRLRRDVAGLCTLYSIVHGRAPELVLNAVKLLPLPVSRSTRWSESVNLGALQVPRSKTESHKLSYIPYYIRLWNNLSNETVFANGPQQFKVRAARELRAKISCQQDSL
jgi:hypothetical protein